MGTLTIQGYPQSVLCSGRQPKCLKREVWYFFKTLFSEVIFPLFERFAGTVGPRETDTDSGPVELRRQNVVIQLNFDQQVTMFHNLAICGV